MKNDIAWKRTVGNVLVGLGLLGVAIAGCGGGGGGGACPAPATCGGNIAGTWQVTSSCLDFSNTDFGCAGIHVSAANTKIAGTMMFAADMTYADNVTISGTVTASYPPSCLTIQGLTLTCAQLQIGLQAQLDDPTMAAPFTSASCRTAGSGCDCDLGWAGSAETDHGTFTTSAGTVTETTNGSSDISDYCVQGNTLTLSYAQSMSAGMMGNGSFAGTVVLTKQ